VAAGKLLFDMPSRVFAARQIGTRFIPPLDGEGVALEERDGWGEYPGGETNHPPDRLPPVDLPARGRYESSPIQLKMASSLPEPA